MDAIFSQIDGNWLRRFRRNLRRWYGQNARNLPWRRTRDPYRIWISEIMLQQTTVAAVVPYYERFLSRFPTVADLAESSERDVLRHWEGLGYYSRARNIHKTAGLIARETGARFPRDVVGLVKLPGIGRYTAGAIASFAFDERSPILEANTLRLYSRLLGYHGDPRNSSGQKVLWGFAERLLPRKSPGSFNQALMELGGTVCGAVPDCAACPVRSCCGALAQGATGEIPPPPQRAQITEVTEAAVAVRRKGNYLMLQRPEGERWAGLWDFPRFAIDEETAAGGRNADLLNRSIERKLFENIGLRVRLGTQIAKLRHAVTRYRITLHCFTAKYNSTAGAKPSTDGKRKPLVRSGLTHAWIPPAEFASYPLSVTGRKIAALIENETSAT